MKSSSISTNCSRDLEAFGVYIIVQSSQGQPFKHFRMSKAFDDFFFGVLLFGI